MRAALLFFGLALASSARASGATIRCDDASTAELAFDGLLDDWKGSQVLARIGAPGDGAIALKCSWDGAALAFALDLSDDRVVRVKNGKGHEDRVEISLAVASGKPISIVVYPGNAIANEKIRAPAHTEVADSQQPKGFSIEARIPATRIPGYSASTPSFEMRIVFHDSDRAAGGDDTELPLAVTIELGDRRDLLEDFLRTVHLKKTELGVDAMAELDPDRHGKERIVAGGTVIGVLTDQFAYVTLPVPTAGDVREVTLLPLGPGRQQVVAAFVRQASNGGSRDLLMLWTVWSGQLQPLAQIEVRKAANKNVLESAWVIAKGAHGPELLVTPKPAVGWTAETWNEQATDDADAIVVPWDLERGGTGYTLHGHQVDRRTLAAKKHTKEPRVR
ncbi:hypothetical protein BH11MYX1_BH11MYX1_56370 [soil metagenome]